MASFWFNAEEEKTIGVLLDYFHTHKGASLKFDFSDGESFWCKYCTDYETDNEYEVEEGLETKEEEFHGVAVEPMNVVTPGKRISAGFELVQVIT